MKKRIIESIIWEYNSLNELTIEEQILTKKALEIAQNAYSPYSQFNVGCAIELQNGTIITGNNQENAAYPSGLCAERVAIFYAGSQNPNMVIKRIAIVAMNRDGVLTSPIYPCGACRQVLLEYENKQKENIELIMYGSNLIEKVTSVKEIVPLYFDGSSL